MSDRTAVETIQAAIEKLEALKAESTPGPWGAMEYDSNPGDQGVPIIGGGEIGSMAGHLTAYTMTLDNEEQSVIDAELIVTLHRTIDAQLAILQRAVDGLSNQAKTVTTLIPRDLSIWAGEFALADAILGEES